MPPGRAALKSTSIASGVEEAAEVVDVQHPLDDLDPVDRLLAAIELLHLGVRDEVDVHAGELLRRLDRARDVACLVVVGDLAIEVLAGLLDEAPRGTEERIDGRPFEDRDGDARLPIVQNHRRRAMDDEQVDDRPVVVVVLVEVVAVEAQAHLAGEAVDVDVGVCDRLFEVVVAEPVDHELHQRLLVRHASSARCSLDVDVELERELLARVGGTRKVGILTRLRGSSVGLGLPGSVRLVDLRRRRS